MSFVNFNLDSISRSEYNDSEVNHELISSTKAFHFCKSLSQTFYDCRKTPQGRVTDPEICFDAASNLLQCYSYIKLIPKPCETQYSSIKSCLDTNQTSCAKLMQSYVDCPLPEFSPSIQMNPKKIQIN